MANFRFLTLSSVIQVFVLKWELKTSRAPRDCIHLPRPNTSNISKDCNDLKFTVPDCEYFPGLDISSKSIHNFLSNFSMTNKITCQEKLNHLGGLDNNARISLHGTRYACDQNLNKQFLETSNYLFASCKILNPDLYLKSI